MSKLLINLVHTRLKLSYPALSHVFPLKDACALSTTKSSPTFLWLSLNCLSTQHLFCGIADGRNRLDKFDSMAHLNVKRNIIECVERIHDNIAIYRVFGNSTDKFSEIVGGTIRIIFCKWTWGRKRVITSLRHTECSKESGPRNITKNRSFTKNCFKQKL